MAITINEIKKETQFSASNPANVVKVNITLDNNYPTGGYDVKKVDLFGKQDFTVVGIMSFASNGSTNAWLRYDADNEKLLVYTGSLVEQSGGTDLSAYSGDLVCLIY